MGGNRLEFRLGSTLRLNRAAVRAPHRALPTQAANHRPLRSATISEIGFGRVAGRPRQASAWKLLAGQLRERCYLGERPKVVRRQRFPRHVGAGRRGESCVEMLKPREGRVVDAKPAREIIDATLGVEGHLHRRGRRRENEAETQNEGERAYLSRVPPCWVTMRMSAIPT